MENKTTIEENFEQLNKIIEQMESEMVSLEDSFELYNKGVALVKDCNEKIDIVEKKIKIVEGSEENETV